ncbi:hypothetical protein [Paucibacter soli]|uniref:hypothetical protein n=1 Tax=Paucibacter soli TaxID=3133433 RepID=UPI0030A4B1B8
MTTRVLYAAGLLLVLSACAAGPQGQAGKAPTEERIADAATAPLADLNLVRAKIPELLQRAQEQPYQAPAERSCAALQAEVRALDEVLGPDVDAQRARQSDAERGGEALGDAAIGGLRGAAEGLLPFRGWVRKLTGAERYSRQVAAAVAAGMARRSYLKGLGQPLACEFVPAPLPAPQTP